MNKVLFTASTYSHIQSFHLPYLRHYQEKGYSVHLACANLPDHVPYVDEAIEVPFQKKMTAPANFRAARRLRKKIAKENYSFICTHTSLAAFFTRLALVGMRKRPKVINMVHGYLFDFDTSRIKRHVLLAAERLMAPYTDLLLTMNFWDHATAKRYKLGTEIHKVPGIGVDFSKFTSISSAEREIKREQLGFQPNTSVLFFAAEFSRRKSQEILIEAMNYLPEEVVLVLAGNGALLEQCKTLVSTHGLDQRVIFPGYVTDVASWYAIADVAVSSSRIEGLPFNVMEAMYSKVPVVASQVKGHDDLIEDGGTGLLYPYGDAKECARQISRILASPALKEQIQVRARERVNQYDLSQVLPIVTKYYDSVLPEQ